MTIDRDALKLIRDIPDWPAPGVIFKDITPLLNDPAAFGDVVDLLADRFRDRQVDHVLGVEARGFIFAAPVAYRLDAGFVPVRKAGKLPWEIEREEYALEYGTDLLEIHRDAISEGAKVLIVDDVLATGGTAAATARLVERLGGVVVGFGFVVDLTFLGGRAKLDGYDVVSLLDTPEPSCPHSPNLCRAPRRSVRIGWTRRSGPPVRHTGQMATVDRVLPWRRHSAPASEELAPLLAAYHEHHSPSLGRHDHPGLRRARDAHDGQTRKSGEPYITHPMSVATIVAELGLDDVTISAALLHDAVEDTGVTLADLTGSSAPTWPPSSTASPSWIGSGSTPRRPSRRPPCARCWWPWPRTCGS